MNFQSNKTILKNTNKLFTVFVLSLITSACSNALPQSEAPELLPADSIKQGPGILSGDDGAYTAIGRKKEKATESIKTEESAVTLKDKNLKQTSQLLEEQIKKSQQNTQQLEQLKRQVDKKLNAY